MSIKYLNISRMVAAACRYILLFTRLCRVSSRRQGKVIVKYNTFSYYRDNEIRDTRLLNAQ